MDETWVQDLRQRFLKWAPEADPERLVFIDESGSRIAMTRETAWAPRGVKPREAVPRNRGTVLTMIAALTLSGLGSMMTIEGGTSSDVFRTWVAQVVVPDPPANAIVVMDNLAARKNSGVREIIETAGASLVFLPPDSPGLNPIELAWGKVKRWLRTARRRTREAVDDALGAIVSLITPPDAAGWFRHCGWKLQAS